jgi:hypothetical protein
MSTEKHAEFSPSQLPRIIACPGSYKASKGQPNPSSPFAEEGTMLHEVMKHYLTKGVYEVGEDATPFTLDDEQRGCVNQLLSWVWDTKVMYNGLEVVEMIEQQVSLSWLSKVIWKDGPAEETWDEGTVELLDGVSGTADYILIVPSERTTIVADWKFGRGVEVFATSDQLKAYALGALGIPLGSGDSHYWRVRAVIGQPRIKSDVEEHLYHTSWIEGELMEEWLVDILIPALVDATSDNPTFNPDEDGACKFCRAVGCRARYEARLKDFNVLIEAEEAQAEVTAEEKVSLVEKFWRLEKYMAVIQGELYASLMAGLPVPGMKLVKGRASRSWALGENATINTLMGAMGLQLKDCYVEPKLCSPAQIEKKLPKGAKKSDDFISLVKTSSGKPSMVPESDKRPALEGVAAQYSADEVDNNCSDDDFS